MLVRTLTFLYRIIKSRDCQALNFAHKAQDFAIVQRVSCAQAKAGCARPRTPNFTVSIYPLILAQRSAYIINLNRGIDSAGLVAHSYAFASKSITVLGLTNLI